MDFIALDYETANADQSSICQVGVASVTNGVVQECKSWLVNPEMPFDPINVSIHKIDENTVVGAPRLKDFMPDLIAKLDGKTVISHSAFDRVATYRVCEKLRLEYPNSTWMDSCRIARRAWPDKFAKAGYGLKNVAKVLGIEFDHHDAGEDAKACAEIVMRAVADSGLDLEAWQSRVNRPILSASEKANEPNAEGPFFGAALVFTGALSLSRKEAAEHAAAVGFTVAQTVTRNTDFLIVGDQDVTKLGGKEKSSKHIKAEKLILDGYHISILSETDFRELIKQTSRNA